MYFVLTDKKSISMRACDLGPFFVQRLEGRLRHEMEGALSKTHDGTVVYIFRIIDRSKPRIQDGTGNAIVEVSYEVWVSEINLFHILNYRPWYSDRSRMK